MKLRLHWLIPAALLASCVSPPDVRPIIVAQQAQAEIFDNQSDALERVIRTAGGLDETKRADLLGKVDENRKRYAALSTVDLIAEVGAVDYAALTQLTLQVLDRVAAWKESGQ